MIGAGTVLAGRYQIESHIASGGMGDVWLGNDRVLGRTVAIKLLRAPSGDPEFVERFRAEARTMATISHPGVVDVYDFGDDPDAGVYLVMKYIEGESLARTLERSPRLSPAVTMRLVAEAAEALHAAHAKGVTHRDVKPGNLLIRPDGTAVLTDFGIARSAAATHQTSTGLLMGTASYIAPERAGGQPATARSDVYSLGVVAYRCLAGRLPFEGESLLQIALRQANDEPAPLPDDVPAAVADVVMRALAKDPAQRWESGAALATAARAALTADPTRAETSVAASRRRLLIGAAAAVAIAAIGAAAVLLNGGGGPPKPDTAAQPGASNPAELAGLDGVSAGPSPAGGSAGASASARGSSGPAVPTASNSARSAAVVPSMPSGLTATPLNAGTIRLTWTDNSGNESGFTVLNGAASRNAGANATSFDWDGLAPDTYMCFKVRAFNATGPSPYFPAAQQDWVCTTTQAGTGPTPPSNLSATALSATAIRLQWTDNSPDESGFTVINGTLSRTVTAGVTSYTWDGLAPGTYMCFKVRAYNPSGVSAYTPTAQESWACATTAAV
ncbi:protein kinase [Dactylosporangium vinaceum]|uniref:non-specific serine/threonine protein kinase n=1 Tax=Dactylosporangium vinaceum TaxID=53362 RepID=A0ABV5M8I1_9ACTN|nr:protein kinase [Dactylosporangium vinaceum]UAB94184.1 protein kinase [Dactylosporangium vinaceum]